MFEMEIALLEPSVQKAHYSSMKIDDIYEYLSIEGHLTICQNKQIVFSEDIAAVEFYWYLLKWYRAEGISRKKSFRYTTVEYVEPILTFSYYHGNQWIVDSPWIKRPTSLVVQENVLKSQVQNLICYFSENLEPDCVEK